MALSLLRADIQVQDLSPAFHLAYRQLLKGPLVPVLQRLPHTPGYYVDRLADNEHLTLLNSLSKSPSRRGCAGSFRVVHTIEAQFARYLLYRLADRGARGQLNHRAAAGVELLHLGISRQEP